MGIGRLSLCDMYVLALAFAACLLKREKIKRKKSIHPSKVALYKLNPLQYDVVKVTALYTRQVLLVLSLEYFVLQVLIAFLGDSFLHPNQ